MSSTLRFDAIVDEKLSINQYIFIGKKYIDHIIYRCPYQNIEATTIAGIIF